MDPHSGGARRHDCASGGHLPQVHQRYRQLHQGDETVRRRAGMDAVQP